MPEIEVTYSVGAAALLVARILGRLLPGATIGIKSDDAEHPWVTVVIGLNGAAVNAMIPMGAKDRRYSPDAVRGAAVAMLKMLNASHALIVQASYYPLPADPNEEEML